VPPTGVPRVLPLPLSDRSCPRRPPYGRVRCCVTDAGIGDGAGGGSDPAPAAAVAAGAILGTGGLVHAGGCSPWCCCGRDCCTRGWCCDADGRGRAKFTLRNSLRMKGSGASNAALASSAEAKEGRPAGAGRPDEALRAGTESPEASRMVKSVVADCPEAGRMTWPASGRPVRATPAATGAATASVPGTASSWGREASQVAPAAVSEGAAAAAAEAVLL
jgi:hypothetical protein